MSELLDRTVLVTGAGSGLGKACAMMAAQAGANLVLGDLAADSLNETAAEVRAAGARVEIRTTDVRKPADCAALADCAISSFGALHGAVCSAGVDSMRRAIEMPLEEWQRVLDVNLTGTFLTVQAAARAMVAKGNPGSIVTLASGIALRGRAMGPHYAASKGGVLAMTKSFALDVARDHVRVNAVAPGVTDTPMARDVMTPEQIAARAREIPLGRIGQPEDIARVVLFLLSDASGWLTGQTLHANGGVLMP